jgi:hypothetical protein
MEQLKTPGKGLSRSQAANKGKSKEKNAVFAYFSAVCHIYYMEKTVRIVSFRDHPQFPKP